MKAFWLVLAAFHLFRSAAAVRSFFSFQSFSVKKKMSLLFLEAKKHWRNARRNLDSTGEKYDIHEAFMSLGQANWCLTRDDSSSILEAERVTTVIRAELEQMKQFLNSDPFAALNITFKDEQQGELSLKDVKQAYRTLVKKWHPDKQKDKSGQREIAHDLFIILQKAYEDLKDDKTRRRLSLRQNRIRHFNATLRRCRPRTQRSRVDISTKNVWKETRRQEAQDTKTKSKQHNPPPPQKRPSKNEEMKNKKTSMSFKSETSRAQRREERAAAAFAAKLMENRRKQKKIEEEEEKSRLFKMRERRKNEAKNVSSKDIFHEAARFNFNASFGEGTASGGNEEGTKSYVEKEDTTKEKFDLRDFVARHAGIDTKDMKKEEEEEEDGDDDDDVPSESNNWLLRPEELVALRAHFAAADFDDDGYLNPLELVRLAGALGEFVTEDEAKILASKSLNKIDFNSFVTWWQDGDDDFNEEELLRSTTSFRSEIDGQNNEVKFPPISGCNGARFWGNLKEDSSIQEEEAKYNVENKKDRVHYWSNNLKKEEEPKKNEDTSRGHEEGGDRAGSSSNFRRGSSGGFFWGSTPSS